MADWHFQYPSLFVRKTVKPGDTGSNAEAEAYAQQFRGDAYTLLYELKNLMTFRKLGQLQMTRFFTDGTVITAKSHFGNDTLIIDVSQSIAITGLAQPTCTITLVNLPDHVQPMRYPGEIKEGEIEGIDYIKTYYTLDMTRCYGCKDQPEFLINFTFATDQQVDYYDSEPNNHCVVSQDGGCRGEIIEQGNDYIIWKVYTETSNQNRSGLGYAQLWAKILDGRDRTKVICEFKQVIAVDCCEKSGLEQPRIYWENWQWAECASGLFFYGGSDLCEVPSIISQEKLFWYAAGEGGRAARFYAIPEIGGCPPYEWRLEGPGSLEVLDPWGRIIVYIPPPAETLGCEDIKIRVTDRCGGEDFFVASCCQFADAMTIEYTTLQMAVNTSQNLGAHGGCPPYTWQVVSGGGTIEPLDDSGFWAKYTAPATNPNCVDNPIIVVSDCCGNSAELKLAINGYTFPGVAYRTCLGKTCPPYVHCTVLPCIITGVFCRYYYQCTGIEMPGTRSCFNGGGPDIGFNCTAPMVGLACESTPPCEPSDYYLWFEPACGGGGWGACTAPNQICNTSVDFRSDAMKAAGCCPVNPQTGLPF